jgi:predicted phage-related endonuclease
MAAQTLLCWPIGCFNLEKLSDMTTDINNTNRNFLIVHAEQRSEEWFEARLGRVTGSMAANVWDKTAKGLRTAGWINYQDQLLAEMMTGMSADSVFVNFEMQRGIDLEPVARRALSKHIGATIRETGFLAHKTLRAGASLDGDIDDFRAVVELKCPKTTTQLRYIEAGNLPDTYMGQCLHNLYVTGAEVLYFGSFDDRLPPHLQLFVKEMRAQDMPLEEYDRDITAFLKQLNERAQALADLAR